MKVGDLVFVNQISTGDNPWMVELYRTKDPVLVVEIKPEHVATPTCDNPWIKILHGGVEKYLRKTQTKVIET